MTQRGDNNEVLREAFLLLAIRAASAAQWDPESDRRSDEHDDYDNARRRLGVRTFSDTAAGDQPDDLVVDPGLVLVFDSLVRDIAGNASGLLHGWLEVPGEVGDLLYRRGWADRLAAVEDAWDLGANSFSDQPAAVQAVRLGFVRAFLRLLLPDELLDDRGVALAELTLPGPRDLLHGEQALQRAVRVMWGSDVPFPDVPSHVVPYLESSDGVYLSTAGVPFDAYAGYGLEFGGEAVRQVPGSYLRNDLPDFVLTGGRSNGYNSMWGFVIRGGGVFASVQMMVSSHVDDERTVPRRPRFATDVIVEFNDRLAPLMDRGRRPLTVGLLYSSYRNDAVVITTDRSAWIEIDDDYRGTELPGGWGIAMTGETLDGSLVPDAPPSGASEELAAAMSFLRAVMLRERAEVDGRRADS